MEASVANGTQAAEAAGGEPTQEQAPQVDLGPVLEQLSAIDSRLGRVEPAIEALTPGPEEPENPLAGLESLFSPEEPEPTGQAELDGRALIDGLRAMQDNLSESQSRALEERLAPVMQAVSSLQVRLDADALTERYPDLAKPEVFQPVVDKARGLAERLGQPALSTSAQFIELVYQSDLAQKYASGEVPAGSRNEFELETGGGSPGGDEPNIAGRIVAARQGNAFWGT